MCRNSLSIFLESKESTDLLTGSVDIPSLPPIHLEQLDIAIGMLLDAVHKNHTRNHTSPFASCLLIMTLAFLTRLIKGQALLEERVGVEGNGQEREEEKNEQGEQLLETESGKKVDIAVCV